MFATPASYRLSCHMSVTSKSQVVVSHVIHKQVTGCHVTCQSQASHRLSCHMSVTSKSQVVMSHVSHKQVTGCHVTCQSQASHRLSCHMSITSKSQVVMSSVSHKQVTGCHVTCQSQAGHRLSCHMSVTSKSQVVIIHSTSLTASHPNGNQAQLLDNLKPLTSSDMTYTQHFIAVHHVSNSYSMYLVRLRVAVPLGYHHSQEQPSLQAFPWEPNYVHAHCHITCMLSRHMHDVTSHARCHVTCTLSRHMHDVTSHARCHVTGTFPAAT